MSVTYNYDIGKVHDTALFITLYFREDDFAAMLCDTVGNEDIVNQAMVAFREFKERNKHIELPPEIAPFVYTNFGDGFRSFLMSIVLNSIHFNNSTKGEALSFLSDEYKIRKRFWRHFFPETDVGIAKRIAVNDSTLRIPKAIVKLAVAEDIKLSLVDMANNFTEYHKMLVDAFKLVYPYIDELHIASNGIFREIKEQLTNKMETRLRDIHKIPDTTFTFPIYFSVLHGLLANYRYWDDDICIGLGLHFVHTLDSNYRSDHISIKSLSRVLGSPIRAQMLDLFDDYECLCAVEIADLLNLEKPSIYPHLTAMFQAGIIYRTNPEATGRGERKYFSLNMAYYDALIASTKKAKKKSAEKLAKGRKRHVVKRKPRKSNDGLTYNEDDKYDE